MPIKVLVADDQTLFRQTLVFTLESDSDLEVVGEAADGHEAFSLAVGKKPEVVLMDLDLPGMNGIQATRLILERHPEIKILVLSVHTGDDNVRKALEAGALGYIFKNADTKEFIQIIKHYARGLTITSPYFVPSPEVIGKDLPENSSSTLFSALTKRELEIKDFLILGLKSKEIADRLNISNVTAKVHIHNIYKKLRVKSQIELILFLNSNKDSTS